MDAVELWETPEADEIYMIAGWRQWADAGSVSSGLPEYLIKRTKARQIGKMNPHGFYIFQVPGTHDLVRPTVKFEEGYPVSLETPSNEFYYTEMNGRGLIIFLGDEPHLDIERYVAALLETAQDLNVRRIIGLGGVYAELPYDKERLVSSVYSLPRLKEEVSKLSVNLSDYEGGASIGSFLCRRAGEMELEYVSFYAFAPAYNFSAGEQVESSIRIDQDFMAWLATMQRIKYMLKLDFDLTELEKKAERLVALMDEKVEEIEKTAPALGVREYFAHLSEEFKEIPFDPLEEVWEDEIQRLFDKYDLDLDDN